MAIRRCPYCNAIIDEGAEFCSNCGTQLLFPEDESIEEEIPGEKIVDEEIEEEAEVSEEEKLEEKEAEPEVPKSKSDEGEEPGPEERDDEKSSFSTEDLEQIIDSEEKEKEEIEKFLKSIKEEREEEEDGVPPTDEFPPWAEQMKEDTSPEIPTPEEPTEEQKSQGERKSREPLLQEEGPPVEEGGQEGYSKPESEEVSQEPEKGNQEEAHEESTSMPDTGMGFPEGVEQKGLAFEEKTSAFVQGEKEKTPSRLSLWLKSRAFDVLFIAAIWIVTLHIASRMIQTNVFRLISGAVFSVMAFYLILLTVYLFLFFLFLGETLGDHLFSQEE